MSRLSSPAGGAALLRAGVGLCLSPSPAERSSRLGKAPKLLTDHLCLSEIISKDKSAIYDYKNQAAFE